MSTSDKICSDGASKLNDDVCEMNDMLQQMSTDDNKGVSICANCGKEDSSDNMNTCNKCTMVKYCNAACKKKHRSKHKKDCEEHIRLAAERAAKLHDEKLFKQPPPQYSDCPICFLRLPYLGTGSIYMICCGKTICSGCFNAPLYDNQGNEVDNEKCPFCRTPWPTTDEVIINRLKKRIEAGDARAIYNIGVFYRDGKNGYPVDHTKALEFFHRAGELGHAISYACIGYEYDEFNRGVGVDKKKATHYYELAAMGGEVVARYNLGTDEGRAGNWDRALKHHMNAIRGGYSDSLNKIKKLYADGHATKEDYTKALQSYQSYLGEIKSKQRDEAAAAREDYRYY